MKYVSEQFTCAFSKNPPNGQFFEVEQTHGTEIITLDQIKSNSKTLPADGISWCVDELEDSDQLAIKTADCLSLLLFGDNRYYLLHAGWRGIAHGILNKPEKLKKVFIFPHIRACCFEVTPDFRDNFPKSPHFIKKEGRLFFDLQSESISRLKEKFPKIIVEPADTCTCCSKKMFHSFRRDKTQHRNYTVIKKSN